MRGWSPITFELCLNLGERLDIRLAAIGSQSSTNSYRMPCEGSNVPKDSNPRMRSQNPQNSAT